MQRHVLKIEGMHCPMCEGHVCHAIRLALPFAKKVKASYRKGVVSFLVEEGTDVTLAITKLESLGYRLSEHQF